MIGLGLKTSMRDISDIIKSYGLREENFGVHATINQELRQWCQRIKNNEVKRDDETIRNLQEYIKRKKIQNSSNTE